MDLTDESFLFNLVESSVDLDNMITGRDYDYDALNKVYDNFTEMMEYLTVCPSQSLILWDAFERPESMKTASEVIEKTKQLVKNLQTLLVFQMNNSDLRELRDFFISLYRSARAYKSMYLDDHYHGM